MAQSLMVLTFVLALEVKFKVISEKKSGRNTTYRRNRFIFLYPSQIICSVFEFCYFFLQTTVTAIPGTAKFPQ